MGMGRGKASLMILTLAFTLVLTADMASTPLVKADGGPVKIKVRQQPYIPGVPVNGWVWVIVDIESPYAWDNTADGIVGWTFDVQVDPDVLTVVSAHAATLDYFLFDFVDWNLYTGHEPSLLVGEINETTGVMRDISEQILGWGSLGVGAGGNSSDPMWYGAVNGLARLRFRSKSETAYSLINITDAAYYIGSTKYLIPDEDITVGHYNDPDTPRPEFTITPAKPAVGESVTFDASATIDLDENIANYTWDFDDGTPLATWTDPIVTHTYTANKTYTVTLNVTDNTGLWDTKSKSVTVYVPPIANFTYSPSEPSVGEIVTFNASASTDPDGGTIVSYNWDFDDGLTVTESDPIATHIYTLDGTYTVTLNLTDGEGLTNATTDTVTVSAVRGELDVEMDVGSIHFRGEIAEFYILTSFIGEPVDVEINATLYYSGGTLQADLSESVEHIAKGLYRVPYTIPLDAPVSTYLLVVNASFSTARAVSLKSFLLSPTLTSQNAAIAEIEGEIATIIIPNLDTIKANLTAINAMLVGMEGTIGIINSTIGEFTAPGDTICATLTEIKGDVATIDSTLGSIEEDIEDINGAISDIDGTLVTIQSDIGEIQANIDDINLKLTAINESVATVDWTDLMQSVEVELDKINTTIGAVYGGLVTINTTLGGIQLDLEDVKDYIRFELVNVTGDIKEGLANVTAAITDAEGNILLELGHVEVKLEDINATLASIDGSLVTIKTDIGTIKGKMTSIQGDIATIETDIGIIKATLQEWTGLTTSSITTPVGTFDVMILTNSTLEGPAAFSDSTLTVVVSGETGTTGILNVMIPRQLLAGLGTNIDEFAVTINGRRVSFTYAEEAELYMVRIIYSHSVETIKIYLSGLQQPFLPVWILSVILLSIAAALIGPTLYTLRTRKKPEKP